MKYPVLQAWSSTREGGEKWGITTLVTPELVRDGAIDVMEYVERMQWEKIAEKVGPQAKIVCEWAWIDLAGEEN